MIGFQGRIALVTHRFKLHQRLRGVKGEIGKEKFIPQYKARRQRIGDRAVYSDRFLSSTFDQFRNRSLSSASCCFPMPLSARLLC